MRGQPIIVRCYGNIPKIVNYWSEDQHAIYVTNHEGIKKLSDGDTSIFPIGFPRKDVFKYDPLIGATINDSKWDWNNLIPFDNK
jgi:hypothetical protein